MAVWLLGRELLSSELFVSEELVSFTDAEIEDTPLCMEELRVLELAGRII